MKDGRHGMVRSVAVGAREIEDPSLFLVFGRAPQQWQALRVCSRLQGKRELRQEPRIISSFLADEVEEHGEVLVILAPSPGFGDVLGDVEAEDDVMLVARGRRRT